LENKTRYDFYWNYIERPKRIIESYVNKIFGWDNPILIQRDVNKHRNELVLDSPFKVVKLLGWTDQYEDDYYWVVLSHREGIQLYSCVGGFVWLKNKLSGFDYYCAVEVWNLNNPTDKEISDMINEKHNGIILK
jgi:hypothetical protein